MNMVTLLLCLFLSALFMKVFKISKIMKKNAFMGVLKQNQCNAKMQEISRVAWESACGAAESSWNKTKNSELTNQERVARAIGSGEQMLLIWFAIQSESVKNEIKKGTINPFTFLVEMRASVRHYVLNNKLAIHDSLLMNNLFSDEVYSDTNLLLHAKEGKDYISKEFHMDNALSFSVDQIIRNMKENHIKAF